VTARSVKEAFEGFSRLRIMIIGDVMVDSYLWGKVERISPEAPVPIVTCTNREDRLGGAANVALNIRSLGASALLCSVIGNDTAGKTFIKLLKQNKMETAGILYDPARKTTQKTRIISSNQHLLRVDEEDTHYLQPHTETMLLEAVRGLISRIKIDAVIFQDYDKGVITPRIIEETSKLFQEAGIPVLVDPKKRNFNLYRNATVFKPNFREFAEGVKADISRNDKEGITREASAFLQKTGHKYLLLTLSEQGVFMSDGRESHHIPAHVRDIADVSGAGDTVISVAALCFASGLSPLVTAEIVNLAGGIVCEKVGVVPVDREQLLQESLQLDFVK